MSITNIFKHNILLKPKIHAINIHTFNTKLQHFKTNLLHTEKFVFIQLLKIITFLKDLKPFKTKTANSNHSNLFC